MTDHLDEALVVARNQFGLAVAEALGARPERVLHVADVLYPAHLPFGAPVIVAHAGHDPQLRDTVDGVCFDRGVPSVGVELLPSRIVCGPMVIPGRTACYSCAERRMEQHAGERPPLSRSTATLPEGFASSHAAIAAGFVRAALAEIDRPLAAPGATVRVLDLVTGTVRAWGTVAVNRCRRCGGRFRDLASPVGALAELP